MASTRNSPVRTLKWFTVPFLSVIAIGLASAGLVSSSSSIAGCQVLVEPLTESGSFTPYEMQRSHLPEVYVNPEGEAIDGDEADLDGLPLRWIETSGDVTSRYYDAEPIVDRPLSSFFADGGVLLAAQPVTDDMVFGDDVPEEIGDRGTEVMVGEHPALLTWADPDRLGTRTHNLYWSDGVTNYSLIADRRSNELVNLARGLACSGEL